MIRAGDSAGARCGVENQHRDRGAALPLVLAFMVLVGAVTVPLLSYASTILRANAGVNAHGTQVEAVKAAFRMSMADPIAVFEHCDSAGVTVGRQLATASLSVPTSTTCYKVDETLAEDPSELRYGSSVTHRGSTVPPEVSGSVYPGAGGDPADAWIADATVDPAVDKIWLPNLPIQSLDPRSPNGYQLDPTVSPDCTVYFPGTYRDDVVIDGRTFFGSGVYYFEGTISFKTGADAVIGGGREQGCTSDQDAAFYTLNAPSRHNMSGLGATFVFGGDGALDIENDGHHQGVSVRFNQRYVAEDDERNLPSAGVSIMTVNGSIDGDPNGTDLVVGDGIHVPLSSVGLAADPTNPIAQKYTPSTRHHVDPNAGLDPSDPAFDPAATLTAPEPVIRMNIQNSSSKVRVNIPGYIAAPQGLVEVKTDGDGHELRLVGGILAADIDLGLSGASTHEIGLVNPVVQKVFLIVSESSGSGAPARSEAVVQINESGAYAINSWEVE